MNLERLFATDSSTLPVFLRLTVGLVMLPHGLQKTLGWFGGYGFEGTVGFFTGTMGLPWALAVLIIVLESAGAAALLAGFLTRPIALGFAAIMLGAVLTVHGQHGFFMNWFGNQGGEGFEYHLLVLGPALGLAASGGGVLSVDAWLARVLHHGAAAPAPAAA